MKYDFVTRKQVREAFTPDVKCQMELAASELLLQPTRELRLNALSVIKMRLTDDVHAFLRMAEMQENQHKRVMEEVLADGHDHTKDDLFLFVVPAAFAGAAGPDTINLRIDEVQRHHTLERHHPEFEIYNDGQDCSENNILEMALDRLARNAQFGDGKIRPYEIVHHFMPTFVRDNARKRSLFWRFVLENESLVQRKFDRMFGVSDWELGRGRFLRLETWKGERRIVIREWNEGVPTKRGVVFPLMRYVVLRRLMDTVQKDLNDVMKKKLVNAAYHIGRDIYATVQSPYQCVSLRRWYLDNDVLKPGKGTTLNATEWQELRRVDWESLDAAEPDLKTTKECQHQEDGYQCHECCPHGLEEIPLLGFPQ